MIIDNWKFFMNQLLTILISMLPVIELKGAIPIAISQYHLPWWQAYIFGVLGTMISAFLIILFLDVISKWLSKISTRFKKLFSWLCNRTRSKHAKKLERYQELALFIIAAIPIPVLGGVWTAALVAFVFGLDLKKSLFYIFLGTLVAGIIFSLGTLGVINI